MYELMDCNTYGLVHDGWTGGYRRNTLIRCLSRTGSSIYTLMQECVIDMDVMMHKLLHATVNKMRQYVILPSTCNSMEHRISG